ncbi:hypothetical protein D3C75_685990 [compost metagenome]
MLGRLRILLFDHRIAAQHFIRRGDGERLIHLNLLFLLLVLAFSFGRLRLILLLVGIDHLPAQTQQLLDRSLKGLALHLR